MKARAMRVTLTRTMLVLAAMLGAAAVRAETEPVIVTDVFGDYQLYRYLHRGLRAPGRATSPQRRHCRRRCRAGPTASWR